MHLVVDIGNTRIKAGLFSSSGLDTDAVFSGDDLIEQLVDWAKDHSIDHIAIASVGMAQDALAIALEGIAPVLTIQHGTPLPIQTSYATLETLGIDRICASVGATSMFPNENLLVIDAGTCITYDLVTSEGTHLGGRISPGFKMRLDAMHHFTARLPQVEPSQPDEMIGRDTKASMQSGSFWGIVEEIDGAIRHYSGEYPNLKVILTGGDSPRFEQHVENPIFAAPDLVLHGIHAILMHNIN